MSEYIFKEGDIVTLKSGGLDMTVERFTWDELKNEYRLDMVDCIWFESKKLKRGSFKTSILRLK